MAARGFDEVRSGGGATWPLDLASGWKEGTSLRPRGTLHAPHPLCCSHAAQAPSGAAIGVLHLEEWGLAPWLHRRGPVSGRGLRSRLVSGFMAGVRSGPVRGRSGRFRLESRQTAPEERGGGSAEPGRLSTSGGEEARFAPARPANPGLNLPRIIVSEFARSVQVAQVKPKVVRQGMSGGGGPGRSCVYVRSDIL
jgi:hypothetical protein